MPKIRTNDEEDDFETSDSDEDYSVNEKRLLKNVRNKRKSVSESEEEVLNVGANEEDSSDDQSDIALSDVDGQDEDDLPDVRAWGKDKRRFYSTDYVDADYGGFQGRDAHLAELEEEEAKNLQQQLAQQLDDADFSLDIFSKSKLQEPKSVMEEVVKSDISKLTRRQKLEILEKESPEFFGLVEDFESNFKVARDLHQMVENCKAGRIEKCSATDFISTYYELILLYCTNICMYLLLKSSRANIQNHPVVKRLYQFKQLLSQMVPIYEENIEPQIENILQIIETGKILNTRPKKILKILSVLKNKTTDLKKDETNKGSESTTLKQKPQMKKLQLDIEESDESEDVSPEDIKDTKLEGEPMDDESKGEVEKRSITYQIAKNKGLTPHRKKEQRNPRVKHRNKYRKAKIRRKGAIREHRTELSRYGGEISGIKSSVTKSIKIKT